MNTENKQPETLENEQQELVENELQEAQQEIAGNELQETPAQDKASAKAKQKKKRKQVSRKLRFGTVATITTAVVVVLILLLNVVMDTVEKRFPLTLDLTADKTYTLSDASVELAQKLEKDVQVVIFSDEATFASPSTSSDTYNTLLTQFYTAVQQYRAESGGKVEYTFVDLDNNPALATKYQDYDVSSGSILFLCDDRYATMTVNDLYSADFSYSTYTYTYTSEVERMVATKINQVSSDSLKTVTLLTGHGEEDTYLSGLTTTLENNGCTVEQLDITTSQEPSEDNSVFVLMAPTVDYTDEEIAKLRAWLDNDGKREKDLVVFVGRTQILPNLFELLNDQYGIEVENNIICETSSSNVYSQNPFYAYGDIVSTDYTEDLVGSRVLSPYTRSLKLNFTDSTDESTYTKQLVTFGETAKWYPLEASEEVTGEDSLVTADSYPLVGAAYTVSRLYDNNDNTYYTTNVLVFGSEAFMYSGLISSVSSAQNESVFLNTFSGLTGMENLISISSRSLTTETLDFDGSFVPMVLGLGVFTFGLPVLLLIVALVVFLRRRHL